MLDEAWIDQVSHSVSRSKKSPGVEELLEQYKEQRGPRHGSFSGGGVTIESLCSCGILSARAALFITDPEGMVLLVMNEGKILKSAVPEPCCDREEADARLLA